MQNLSDFKDKYLDSKESLVLICNGPSLNAVDLDEITSREGVLTMGSNGIGLKFTPDFLVCVNPLAYSRFEQIINGMDCVKFISGQNLDTSYERPAFRYEEPFWEGHTVTFVMLQLALYMGFRDVVIVGMDHYFEVPAGTMPNAEISLNGADDPNHFDPEYFKGVTWHAPDLKMSELAYSLAQQAYQEHDGFIVNCSAQTACEVFPVEPFNYVTTKYNFRVSAIVSAYFAEDMIEGCIRDLLDQTEYTEILVVCQEGSPEFEHVMDPNSGYKSEMRVRVIATPDVPTIYEAWNLGVQMATGQYLTNANTDDRHRKDALEIAASVLDANQHIDLVYYNSYVTWEKSQLNFDAFEESILDTEIALGRDVEGQGPGIFLWPDYTRNELASSCFIGPHPMWRANLHQKHGLFDPDMKSAGDYEFWLRVSKENNFYHIPVTLGLYHASLDGVELRDPELSAKEGMEALSRYQSPNVTIEPISGDTARVRVGSSYAFTSSQGLLNLAERLTMVPA